MPKTVVQNNEARMHQIQVSSGAPKWDGDAKRNVPADFPAQLLILNPGVNLVEEGLWKRAKQNERVANLLKLTIQPTAAPEQAPERVGQPILVEGETLPDENMLKGLGLREVKKLVAETLDTNILNLWRDEADKADVRRAIDEQIDAIEKPKDAERRSNRRKASGG